MSAYGSHIWLLRILLGSLLKQHLLKEVFPLPALWEGGSHPSNSVSHLSDLLLRSYHDLKLRGLLIPLLVYGLRLLS